MRLQEQYVTLNVRNQCHQRYVDFTIHIRGIKQRKTLHALYFSASTLTYTVRTSERYSVITRFDNLAFAGNRYSRQMQM